MDKHEPPAPTKYSVWALTRGLIASKAADAFIVAFNGALEAHSGPFPVRVATAVPTHLEARQQVVDRMGAAGWKVEFPVFYHDHEVLAFVQPLPVPSGDQF